MQLEIPNKLGKLSTRSEEKQKGLLRGPGLHQNSLEIDFVVVSDGGE